MTKIQIFIAGVAMGSSVVFVAALIIAAVFVRSTL